MSSCRLVDGTRPFREYLAGFIFEAFLAKEHYHINLDLRDCSS
jgi:hypothetical protein